MPLPCSATDCPYTTEEIATTLSDMLELLRLHTQACHPAETAGDTPKRGAQPERAKRPILSLSGQSLEQEDYEHFMYMFAQYKNRVGKDEDGATLLRECLGTDISKILYSNFGNDLSKFSEEEIKNNIVKCCVTRQTAQARATELHRLKQDAAQSVHTFLASLKAKARQCDLKISCTSCQTVNDYSEQTILTLLLRGLNDTDLQQDLLAEPDLTLDKCVTIATARETAKRSQETFLINEKVDALSSYKKSLKKIGIPEENCGSCGKKPHKDSDDCPAKDNICTCGVKGHLTTTCFKGGKPPDKPAETTADKAEAVETEASSFLSATCFSITAEPEQFVSEVEKHEAALSQTPVLSLPTPAQWKSDMIIQAPSLSPIGWPPCLSGVSTRQSPDIVWGELSPGFINSLQETVETISSGEQPYDDSSGTQPIMSVLMPNIKNPRMDSKKTALMAKEHLGNKGMVQGFSSCPPVSDQTPVLEVPEVSTPGRA